MEKDEPSDFFHMNDEDLYNQITKVKERLLSVAYDNEILMEVGINIPEIIEEIEKQVDKFRMLTNRLATVNMKSSAMVAELEENNERLTTVSAEATELMVELEEKNDALQRANNELARANVHAAELMAEVEVKDQEIKGLNSALAKANVIASELIAELDLRKEELEESGYRYKLLFNHSNDAIFLHAFEEDGSLGNFIEVNDIACQWMGFTREEILSMKSDDIWKDAEEDGVENPDKDHKIVIKILKTKDGREIPVEISSQRYFLDGEPIFMGIARDISERIQAEGALRKSRKDLERFNQLAIGREQQMIELKCEVNSLLRSMGKSEKYKNPAMTKNESDKEFKNERNR
jgi:PAS domain S-box-containing protein